VEPKSTASANSATRAGSEVLILEWLEAQKQALPLPRVRRRCDVVTKSPLAVRHRSKMGVGEILLNVIVAMSILAGLIWALKKTGNDHHEPSSHEK
jgi:hypothetical protein